MIARPEDADQWIRAFSDTLQPVVAAPALENVTVQVREVDVVARSALDPADAAPPLGEVSSPCLQITASMPFASRSMPACGAAILKLFWWARWRRSSAMRLAHKPKPPSLLETAVVGS